MNSNVAGVRVSRFSRVLVTMLLIFSLVGGAGVVAADGEDNSGKECPGQNPNEGSEHASTSGTLNSAEGFAEALEGTGCIS